MIFQRKAKDFAERMESNDSKSSFTPETTAFNDENTALLA